MSEDRCDDKSENMEGAELSPQEMEKVEEAKLKAKYPGNSGPNRFMGGHSAFLQKRLAKGQKYFDSGDYQMAKQKKALNQLNKPPMKAVPVPTINPFPTGDAIPTPETIPVRKTSIMQSSKFTPNVS